jgi:hypothetical protein
MQDVRKRGRDASHRLRQFRHSSVRVGRLACDEGLRLSRARRWLPPLRSQSTKASRGSRCSSKRRIRWRRFRTVPSVVPINPAMLALVWRCAARWMMQRQIRRRQYGACPGSGSGSGATSCIGVAGRQARIEEDPFEDSRRASPGAGCCRRWVRREPAIREAGRRRRARGHPG